MKRLLAILVLAGTSAQAESLLETFGSEDNQFQIEFVTIGNAGNTSNASGLGSVNYVYNLSKYEISRGIIEKANNLGALGLSLKDMSSYGGNGTQKPATGISFLEAAKFINFINTSTGNSPAYKIGNYIDSYGQTWNDLQFWSSNESGYDPSNKLRNSLAKYFLPTRDEWFKGAFGSPNGDWYNYATGSDQAPTSTGGGLLGGTAVYGQPMSVGPADVNNAGGLSAWGTMAQTGNVRERLETSIVGGPDAPWAFKEVRGGGYQSSVGDLESSSPFTGGLDGDTAVDWQPDIGFRIASVPEPSSLSLLLAGGAVLMAGRRRKY